MNNTSLVLLRTLGVILSVCNNSFSMPLEGSFYLDARDEHGSIPIFNTLGIRYNSKDISNLNSKTLTFDDHTCNAKLDERSTALTKEHKSHHSIIYSLTSGSIFIDVRDSAGAWLRSILAPGDVIEIAPSLYRRFSIPPSKVTSHVIEYTENNKDGELLVHRFSEHDDSIAISNAHNTRELVCNLCRQFFEAGWVTGTGGSISIRHGNRIYMTPSGVQKERINPDELFVLDVDGNILSKPSPKPGFSVPKLSDCSPLFLHAFKQRNAGAVLHSHHINCNLATVLFDGQPFFRISHQEMIKAMAGYGYFDELVIPIIENTAWEHELADSLGEAIAKNPRANAVLVRRHGIYVWGATWEQAKRHAEALHYLFEVALKMHHLGFDTLSPPRLAPGSQAHIAEVESRKRQREDGNGHGNGHANGASKRGSHSGGGGEGVRALSYSHVVCDIEGTMTPITFVKDVLFPFASTHVTDFLATTWESPETVADVEAICSQAAEDAKAGLAGCPKVGQGVPKEEAVRQLSEWVRWSISQDRKVGALKQLQGHIWGKGYSSGELQSTVYEDIPEFLQRAKSAGVSVAIYSSGSREAQHSLFKSTNFGDLRPLLSCYFDTAIGHKRTKASYREILLTLGAEKASDVLFVTDILEEAQAAREAGMDAVLSVRPGNAPLPYNHGFPSVASFRELY